MSDETTLLLTAEQVEKAIHDCSTYASYDGCTYYASGIRLQAIADELNATLGGDVKDCENLLWEFIGALDVADTTDADKKPIVSDYARHIAATLGNSRADYHGYEQAAIEAWESIKAWNSRAERTCHIEGSYYDELMDECYTQLSCDHETREYEPNYCPTCGARVVGRDEE